MKHIIDNEQQLMFEIVYKQYTYYEYKKIEDIEFNTHNTFLE